MFWVVDPQTNYSGGKELTIGCFPSELSGERRRQNPLPLVQPSTTDNGCQRFQKDYTGKAVILDRGGCFFCVKISNAMLAGADAVLIVNSHGELPYEMSWVCDDYSDPILYPNGIGIPACMVSRADGQALKISIATGVAATVGFEHFRTYNSMLEAKPENDVTSLAVQQLLGGYNPLPAGQVPVPTIPPGPPPLPGALREPRRRAPAPPRPARSVDTGQGRRAALDAYPPLPNPGAG